MRIEREKCIVMKLRELDQIMSKGSCCQPVGIFRFIIIFANIRFCRVSNTNEQTERREVTSKTWGDLKFRLFGPSASAVICRTPKHSSRLLPHILFLLFYLRYCQSDKLKMSNHFILNRY